jgi:hypothetical protein
MITFPMKTTTMRAPLVVLFALLSVTCARQEDGFKSVVLEQCARYPRMQMQDLYKLAFQGALGNEHLMTDTALVRDYLRKELEELGPLRGEPLFEEITPGGTLVRVNLRPFKDGGGDPERLLDAMFQTASAFEPSEERLESYLLSIRQLARDELIPITLGEFLPYVEHLRTSGFPAVHHSASYEKEYHPAYRVVLRALLPDVSTD